MKTYTGLRKQPAAPFLQVNQASAQLYQDFYSRFAKDQTTRTNIILKTDKDSLAHYRKHSKALLRHQPHPEQAVQAPSPSFYPFYLVLFKFEQKKFFNTRKFFTR